MKRAIVLVAALAAPAWGKGDKKPAPAPAPADDAADDSDDDTGDDAAPDKKKKPAPAIADDDTGGAGQQDKDFQKQDLNGHDLGTSKKENEFERDRFFVDKIDASKTKGKTLVQGSLASSSLYYGESGGAYASANPAIKLGNDSSDFSRMFTELRLQTDFRHIQGGKWDARVDTRLRAVSKPRDTPYMGAAATNTTPTTPTHIQSGLTGTNEYDIRELWIVRNGAQSDVFIGRQFIPDLAAIKIDGLRVDYASSSKITYVGFAGLYPERGSRSLSTDYPALRTNQLDPAGKLVGAAGFGAAYRTIDAYGAIGGVALVPFQAERPRIFATSNGYWRYGSKLDFYHYLVADLVNQSYSSGSILTNLSAGLNYKPSPRLRVTASFNRVDTETLNVQANAYLNPVDPNLNAVQNETFIQRLSTNLGRVGVSAGLGQLQRFELSAAVTYRYRPSVTLIVGDPGAMTPQTVTLAAGKGVDLYASLVDRHSVKDLRLGVDISRTFATGTVAFQRSDVFAIRFSGAHELAGGKGEWEAELSYATTKDHSAGINCADISSCYGASTGSILSLGGNVYYRINHDWFTLVSVFLTRQGIVHTDGTTNTTDPTITGLTGFFRLAYRF